VLPRGDGRNDSQDFDMHIRNERPADARAIYTLTAAAFADMPYSDGDEPELIEALRADGALDVSLVATVGDDIVGHIAFSRVTIDQSAGDWFGLGPVSVHPDRQRQGIGSALIREGLARIAAMGAAGCVLLGHIGYYGRFGFAHDPGLTFAGAVNPAFQVLTLKGETPRGEAVYHPAFYG
jgi:predicted N-acetyltransferase YhbS